MRNIKHTLTLVFVFLLMQMLSAQPVQYTLGTGTSYNTTTGYPAPYGNFYWGARHQFLIRASELQALGATGQRIITDLGFNVFAPIGGALVDFQIKLKHTTNTGFATSGYVFETGTTTVFGPTAIPVSGGWNMHTFHTPFVWNGVSNIIVEVCFNNTGYTTNAQTYFSTLSYGSSIYFREDATGVCGKAANTRSTNRPNMRLSMSLPLPPVARFNAPDTVFINKTINFKSQSENALRYYWKVDSATGNSLCNSFGCFIDTTSTDLNYTFTKRGLYKITLINRGYLGDTNSMVRYVFADTTKRKPQANFYSSVRSAGIFDQIFFYDSSLFGVYGWEWSFSPPCVTCGQFANVFTPSVNAERPILNTFDPGIYDICLIAWNDKGADTICKKSYINILPSFFMCNGSDSFTRETSGLVTDVGGASSNYQIGQIGQCNSGFTISPSTCADTLYLYIDQFKLRDLDTLEIRNGTSKTGPLLARYSGGNLSASQKLIKASAGEVFMRMKTGGGITTAGDSGFAIRWGIAPAAAIIQPAASFCPGDSILLRTIKRSNRAYQWMYAGQPISIDTFVKAKDEGMYGLQITQTGCTASQQINLAIREQPQLLTIAEPMLLQCADKNLFTFINRSQISKGTITNSWKISDGTQYAGDTLRKVFFKPGQYQVFQQVVSDSGCIADTAYTVRVKEKPDVAITYTRTPDICAYDSMQLAASSTQAVQYQWWVNGAVLSAPGTIYAYPTDSVRLLATDAFGCDSLSARLIINKRPTPAKPVIERNGAFLRALTGNSRITWYLGVVPLADKSKEIIPQQNGIYVVVSDSNGCTAVSNKFPVMFTAIDEQANPKRMLLYPNPFTSAFSLEVTEDAGWQITDIAGRICLQGRATAGINQISAARLMPGVYLMQINEHYIRIVKQ